MGLVRRLATVRYKLSDDDDEDEDDEAHLAKVAAKGAGMSTGTTNTSNPNGGEGPGAPTASGKGGGIKFQVKGGGGTQDLEAASLAGQSITKGPTQAAQAARVGCLQSFFNGLGSMFHRKNRVASNATGKRKLNPSMRSSVREVWHVAVSHYAQHHASTRTILAMCDLHC